MQVKVMSVARFFTNNIYFYLPNPLQIWPRLSEKCSQSTIKAKVFLGEALGAACQRAPSSRSHPSAIGPSLYTFPMLRCSETTLQPATLNMF